jgi:hypothetical protein
MKLLLLSPGASYSTADVEAGLRYGLEHHGVQVIQYRLDHRIRRAQMWLKGAWKAVRKTDPTFEKPNVADVFFQAGIGALEMALRHQVDCVLVVSGMFLHPDVVILMKRAGLRVTVLMTESPYDDQELRLAGLVDGCWTNERTSVSAFQNVNANSGYIPHGWHPDRHKPGPQPGDEDVPSHDVVFVGTGFRERINFLKAINWTGIDFGLYGSWAMLPSTHRLRQHLRGGCIDNVQAAALYRRAKIGLNLYREYKGWNKQEVRVAYAESINPRGYELAACGAFHLSTYRAEVADVFGNLVPTFSHPTECAALMRAWLADPDGRTQVALSLPARVAEASWTERASRIIGDLQTLLQPPAAVLAHTG